jgi:hypothetical protein
MYRVILNYCRGFRAIIFKLESSKIILTEYESVTQKVLFCNTMLAALMYGENMTSYVELRLFK